LVRHFHQPKEYWLDHCTLQEWQGTYHRELIERPPAEDFLASYFGYEAPSAGTPSAEAATLPELPDFEE